LPGGHGAGEADDGAAVREDAGDAGAAPDLLAEPFLRVAGPDLAPYLTREAGKGQDVVPGLVPVGGGPGSLASGAETAWACRARTEAAPGCSKMARTRVDAQGWADFGTLASRLRWERVLQRCHAALGRTEAMAGTRPAWPSLAASATPDRPRAARPRRNAGHPAPSSLLVTPAPGISRCPPAFTPVAIRQRTFTVRPPSRAFWVRAPIR